MPAAVADTGNKHNVLAARSPAPTRPNCCQRTTHRRPPARCLAAVLPPRAAASTTTPSSPSTARCAGQADMLDGGPNVCRVKSGPGNSAAHIPVVLLNCWLLQPCPPCAAPCSPGHQHVAVQGQGAAHHQRGLRLRCVTHEPACRSPAGCCTDCACLLPLDGKSELRA